MGDFEKTGPGMAVVRKPTLREAVRKVTESFDASPLNGKFEMTIQDGYNIQRALNRVSRALADLEEKAQAYLP